MNKDHIFCSVIWLFVDVSHYDLWTLLSFIIINRLFVSACKTVRWINIWVYSSLFLLADFFQKPTQSQRIDIS